MSTLGDWLSSKPLVSPFGEELPHPKYHYLKEKVTRWPGLADLPMESLVLSSGRIPDRAELDKRLRNYIKDSSLVPSDFAYEMFEEALPVLQQVVGMDDKLLASIKKRQMDKESSISYYYTQIEHEMRVLKETQRRREELEARIEQAKLCEEYPGVDNFYRCLGHPGWRLLWLAVGVRDVHAIFIQREDTIMRDGEGEVNLGRYRLHFKLDEYETPKTFLSHYHNNILSMPESEMEYRYSDGFSNWRRHRQGNWQGESHIIHPYVNDGVICWGNSGADYQNLALASNFRGLLHMLTEMLATYTETQAPYRTLKYFRKAEKEHGRWSWRDWVIANRIARLKPEAQAFLRNEMELERRSDDSTNEQADDNTASTVQD